MLPSLLNLHGKMLKVMSLKIWRQLKQIALLGHATH